MRKFERWALRMVKRHARSSNPYSMRMAKVLVMAAKDLDAGNRGWRPGGTFGIDGVAAHLIDCGPHGDFLEEIRAGMWERILEERPKGNTESGGRRA